MLHRPFAPALLTFSFLVLWSGISPAPASAPARVVVRNDTYSSLLVSMEDDRGREVELGHAPPEFSNTLIIKEPLPSGEVRFLARLAGSRDVLYRSDAVRLRSGAQVRWHLPDNRIGR